MPNSKLVSALRTLSPEEWSLYNRYLKVQVRTRTENYKCFKAIYNQKDKLYESDCEEKIKQKHFPQLTPKAFSNILSRLFGHFETWLAEYEFANEKYAIELQLIKVYNEKGLFKLANQHAKKLEKKIKAEQYLDIDQNRALAQLYYSQYYSSNPIKKEKGSTLFDNCLLHFRNTTKENALGYLNEMANRAILRNIKDEESEEQLTVITNTFPDTSFSEILNAGYKLRAIGDLDSYVRIEKILEEEAIAPESDWYLILSIFLTKRTIPLYEKGFLDPKKMLSAFEYTFRASEKNRNQKFSSLHLFNAIDNMAIFLQYEEMENFLNRWIEKIHTEHKTSALSYCKALIAFRNENYELMPALLSGLSFDNQDFKIYSNILLIIAHYELGEEELVYTLIGNFRKQLKRNEHLVMAVNYTRIENLMEIILLLLKSQYDKNVRIDLAKYEGIFYRTWVMKKLGPKK